MQLPGAIITYLAGRRKRFPIGLYYLLCYQHEIQRYEHLLTMKLSKCPSYYLLNNVHLTGILLGRRLTAKLCLIMSIFYLGRQH